MLVRSLAAVSLALVTLAGSGCAAGRVSFSYYDDPRPVRVTRAHRHARNTCTHDCHDCYWDGAKVVIIKGHRHGPGCGHLWDGKRWVVVKKGKGKAKRAHPPAGRGIGVMQTHGPRSGHVYDRRGHKWLKVRGGHVHGPGCGHIYVDGRWCIRY